MDNPKLTVLMPVYNGSQFLREAIESILMQVYRDFEFLIIDDGSTDNSLEIIRSYSDARIRVKKNVKNIGLTKSLNIGIGMARGEYLARMDADDISHQQRFKRQVDFLDKNAEVDVCGSWLESIDTGKEIIFPLTDHEIKFHLLFGSPVAHPSVMMKYKILEKHSFKYNESFLSSQDYDLWSRISDIGVIANIEDPLIKYRSHDNQISKRHSISQNLSANIVRKREFSKLGLDVSTDDIDRFVAFYRGEFDGQISSLVWVNEWIFEMLNANRDSRRFDDNALGGLLAEKLWKFCNAAAYKGLDPWRIFYRSQVSHLAAEANSKKLKFLAKCLIRPFLYRLSKFSVKCSPL